MIIPHELSIEVTLEIKNSLAKIPPNDRIGFLFGAVIGALYNQGFTKDGIRKEILNGLEFALSQLGN
jgi:hypothetical protein